jgi:hypothetical protein
MGFEDDGSPTFEVRQILKGDLKKRSQEMLFKTEMSKVAEIGKNIGGWR